MGTSLKTSGWDEINNHLNSAMVWLRNNSDGFESPRRISLSIRGLIAGGDPPQSHHIQRLVTKLKKMQYSKGTYKDGSWSGEVYDTANALMALNKASLKPQPDPRKDEFLKKGLEFLEKYFDKKLNNWLDYLPETIVSCQAILELGDLENQKKNLESALDWVCSRTISSENCFVSTMYTNYIVQLLLLANKLTQKNYDNSIEFGIKHIIDAEASGKWSDDPWAISQSLLAIMKHNPFAKQQRMIQDHIYQLMEMQSPEHAWGDSVTKTTSCIMVFAEALGYKQISENRLNYWTSFSPTSGKFSWDQIRMENNDTLAIGKIEKYNRGLSSTTIEQYKTELPMDLVQADIDRQLNRVSAAADSARKRGIQSQIEIRQEDNYDRFVIETLEEVGKDIYTSFLQHGEKNKLYEKALSNGKLDHITIAPDETMAIIPWELVYDGNDFCCLKYSVGRLLPGTQNDEIQTRSEGKPKVLLIGDISGDLPEANNEIKILSKFFDDDHFEKDFVSSENFDPRNERFRMKFLKMLRDNKYDIIHYAGHADFDTKSYLYFDKSNTKSVDKASALEIYDHIKASGSTPKIVFFNACSSAARENLEDPSKINFDKKFSNLARDFVKVFSDLNVPAYVGAIWPIHDKEAAEFAVTFYQSIKYGCTIGDAIRLARIDSYLNHPDRLTWASFILYGDPARKLDVLKVKTND